jgi:transposase InsO family protein
MHRGQIDLFDMQTLEYEGYKWAMHYQDHTGKISVLSALKSKCAKEVAQTLVNDVFSVFGAPRILQSDNGREFVAKVIEELKILWPQMIIVHGRARHPQSQGSVERANGDVKKMLGLWMKDNNSKNWPLGK